jgi:aryl-alcohol dehydrogenase-like predicted oxidoreductase
MTTSATSTAALSFAGGTFAVPPLGVGVWSWGDRGFWGYGKTYGRQDVNEAFVASINAGARLFDTAEIYGFGESECILGELVRTTQAPAVVASKFAPLPWRLSAGTIDSALRHSLQRLGMQQIDLYQIHWPYSLLSIHAMMDALADAVAAGKIRAVGVSNFSAEQMYRAHEALARRGIPLASNQVYYSLLHRAPEINGVLDACRELDAVLIAFSPLTQGLLTGKFSSKGPRPRGRRSLVHHATDMRKLETVLTLLREIGQQHGGKKPGQVALAWLIGQGGVMPIPGAKNARQAAENAGALDIVLTPDEQAALDAATRHWRRRGL